MLSEDSNYNYETYKINRIAALNSLSAKIMMFEDV